MIRIKVSYPKIHGDTVIFDWKTNKKISFIRKNNFYVKYENLIVETLPLEVFWYGFLALMVPVFDMCDENVLLEFPEAIPSIIAETWINNHNAKKIQITPLSSKKTIDMKLSNPQLNSDYKAAVLYGGGKDSTYAYSIFSEIVGIDKVLLVSYVHSWSDNAIKKVNQRRDKFILNPLKKDLNAKIQKIFCDFPATVIGWSAIKKPQVALYSGTILPIMILYNIPLLIQTNDSSAYFTRLYNSVEDQCRYMQSRPEMDDYLSNNTNDFFGTDYLIKNLTYFISGVGAFKVLVERYPKMLKYITMCETIGDQNKKWCGRCKKCGEFVLYSLCWGYNQKEINVSDFFANSNYIKNIIRETSDLKTLNDEHGNFPWDASLGLKTHYEWFCHAIANIEIDYIRKITSEEAFNNFMMIKNRYGNKKFPLVESLVEPAINKLWPPYLKEIMEITSQHCKLLKDMPEYFYFGNEKAVFDYNIEYPIPNVFQYKKNNTF